MNDFPTCPRHTTGNQFADDTITYAPGDIVVDLQGLRQEEVSNISAWLNLSYVKHMSGIILVGTRQQL